MAPSSRKLPLAACFGILLAITAGYQWFYCYASTNGNITGLFFSGSRVLHPPELEHYGFHYKDSFGYDGQMYRMIAHDPFHRKGYWNYLDDSRLRGRRILIAFMAGLLGGDSIAAVDYWYVSIVDIFLVLGGVCFVLLTDEYCSRLSAIGLYSIIPAVVASTDRMVLDGPSVAGFLGALWFYKQGRRRLLLMVLVLLPFLRETNLAVAAGFALVYLTRRNIRGAVAIVATAAPTLAWFAYITTWTPPSSAITQISLPLLPQVLRLITPLQRPLPFWENRTMQAIDLIGVAALLFTFGLFVVAFMKARISALPKVRPLAGEGPIEDVLVVLPLAVMLAFIGGTGVLSEAYAFMRVDSLLVAWAALYLLRSSCKMRRGASFAFLRNPLRSALLYLAACSIGILIFRVRPIVDVLGKL